MTIWGNIFSSFYVHNQKSMDLITADCLDTITSDCLFSRSNYSDRVEPNERNDVTLRSDYSSIVRNYKNKYLED